MGKVIDLRDYREDLPDLYEMDVEDLQAYLAQCRKKLQALDEQEPEDMNSEAYEDWGQRHEDLEDEIDEILDLLDERM